MPNLPDDIDFLANNVPESQFRAKYAQLLQYLRDLLGRDGTAAGARRALGLANLNINFPSKGVWAPDTDYGANVTASVDGTVYLSQVGHTSGATFQEDYQAGRWSLFQGLSKSEFEAEKAAIAANATAGAQTAQAAAEAARDAAFVSADVYPDIAAGLAAVGDGKQFQVVSADGMTITRYRRNSAVAATPVAQYPAALAVANLRLTLQTEAPLGYAWSVADGDGDAALGVKDDGTVSAAAAEIGELTTNDLRTAGARFIDEQHVGLVVVLASDGAGGAAAGVDDSGALVSADAKHRTINGLPVASPGSRYGGAYPYQVGYINNVGESLAEGSTGPAITTAQEYDNICWPARTTGGGPFLPSNTGNGQYSARGENPMFGAQSAWKKLICDENGLIWQHNDFRLLACNNGYSGYKIAQISKGTAPYAAMLSQAAALNKYGEATEKSVGWLCNILTIGANDGNPASLTDAEAFMAQTLALASDLDTDVRALIPSQTRPVITVINQVSSRAPQLAVRQLECSHASPLVVVAGPMYQYTYYDALHINPASERAMGALCGLAAKRTITDGRKWEPLQPVSHVQTGASIVLRFNRCGIAFDEARIPKQAGFGFSCFGANNIAVPMSADPVIYGRDGVKFVFASTETAASVASIRAGHNTSTGRADSFVGGSTNLRTTNSAMVFDGADIFDWCVIFNYSI